jgi:hypothetical protein
MNLQESIRTLLKEEYGRKYILYRGVGLDEAIKSCETGHLVYYSRDPMSRDWEVIEYGLGSEASEMSEEEVEEYVNDLVSWKRKSKGVNLTSDLDNAKGYSDIVLEINLVGYDYAEFSDVHIFAKNPEDCKIKSVYYNGKEYSKEEFLDITKSLQESIRRILREETNPKQDLYYEFKCTDADMDGIFHDTCFGEIDSTEFAQFIDDIENYEISEEEFKDKFTLTKSINKIISNPESKEWLEFYDKSEEAGLVVIFDGDIHYIYSV